MKALTLPRTPDFTDVVVPLSMEKIRILNNLCVCSRYQRGQTLFYEGHRPWGLYILKSGRLSLSTSPGGRASERIIIVNEPSALDVVSFYLSRPHPVTARILATSEISIIPKSVLADLDFSTHPGAHNGDVPNADELVGRFLTRLVERGHILK